MILIIQIMDNCCACIDSPEVNQAYRQQKIKAVYLSGHSIQEPARIQHSAVLTRNVSERHFAANPQNEVRNQQSQIRIVKINEYRSQNMGLRTEVQNRKRYLWQRADQLQNRCDFLRIRYVEKNVQLQGLLGQINRHFG